MSSVNGKAITLPDGSTSLNAAYSATQLKEAGISTNGAYWYKFADGNRQLWTDFTTYPNYPMVLVTRISAADQLQYLAAENQVADLVTCNTTAPSRSAKISDSAINEIIKSSTIKWVMIGQKAIFYRMNGAKWFSNFGQAATCSPQMPTYNAYATPSNTPTWLTDYIVTVNGACGGLQDATGTWILITGIHNADNIYMGGYSGASSYRGSTPTGYTVATYGDSSWTCAGYVFLSW